MSVPITATRVVTRVVVVVILPDVLSLTVVPSVPELELTVVTETVVDVIVVLSVSTTVVVIWNRSPLWGELKLTVNPEVVPDTVLVLRQFAPLEVKMILPETAPESFSNISRVTLPLWVPGVF
ncbi:MAG: hypothetical protein HKN50_00655 [Gammaproteobacteria bacterium]|nr:hypothetical protein [Gammaproteobacteria bacterium]